MDVGGIIQLITTGLCLKLARNGMGISGLPPSIDIRRDSLIAIERQQSMLCIVFPLTSKGSAIALLRLVHSPLATETVIQAP